MKLSYSNHRVLLTLALTLLLGAGEFAGARPVVKLKGGTQTPQTFRRQRNTLSNMDFFFTNRGVLFNNSSVAGLQWPRGTAESYIFGGGLWFATKKVIGGKRRKLCELGYNPNSGAGWYREGEFFPQGSVDGTGLSSDTRYKSFVSSRYDNQGRFTGSIGSNDPNAAPWPLWDSAESKTLNRNYYFGDFISNEGERVEKTLPNGKKTKPAIISQEDIVNIYTDADYSQNPEFKPNSGYPFYLNITEVIYSWSFGAYRDMIFLRHKVKNASTDTLYECYMAPAFDPDLGIGSNPAGNDHNRYVDYADSTITKRVLKGTCFERDPRRLNMALQYSEPEQGKEYGVIGFSFLESPPAPTEGGNREVRDLSDSESVGGYNPNDPNRIPQLGLATFKKWQIQNDPPTSDLRYDFLSDGSRDGDNTAPQDVRLLFSTGPFTLPPGKTAETVVGIGIAHPSTTDRQKNIDSLFKLMVFAHSVFGGDCYGKSDTLYAGEDTIYSTIHEHFASPAPPQIPNLKATCLDRAILVEWDSTAERSADPLSPKTLAFIKYDLYRTTRSDFDSTIRPDGINPIIKLGSWSLFDLDENGVRKNAEPNVIPHSFLDIGDDNKDGVLTANESLLNGVKYYYFLIAYDELDSVSGVGPLASAVVAPKNFVTAIPCKPVFPDLPPEISAGKPCFSGEDQGATPPVGGMKAVTLEVIDTGKYLQFYDSDNIIVSFQPRWTEYGQQSLNASLLNMYMDVRDTKTGINLTYDALTDPNNPDAATPYYFEAGLTQDVIGQKRDSVVKGRFITNSSSNFAPNQTINQAFTISADYEFTQLIDPYKLKSITGLSDKTSIVHLSKRTYPGGTSIPDIANMGTGTANLTNPSFQGLGEVSYKVGFGKREDLNEQEYDTATNSMYAITQIEDPSSPGTVFKPRPIKVSITSNTHCDQPLALVRENTRNDISQEYDYRYYANTIQDQLNPNLYFPTFNDPDTMLVPIPGKFTIDAYHYVDESPTDHIAPQFIMKTSGDYYYPGVTQATDGSNKWHFAIHRIRLAGAEIIINAADYPDASTTGDEMANGAGQSAVDFGEDQSFDVNFTGQAKGLPFPGAQFVITTQPLDYRNTELYKQQEILDQVQVVPNPYVVSHLGQTSTDNAKLFFTRLPPRATIEIYTVSGDLVKTIEHNGYVRDQTGAYNYDVLADRYNTEEWNILSEGRQRVGSQVLIARVIAKDPRSGADLGETRVKFAVVLGGYRQVVR